MSGISTHPGRVAEEAEAMGWFWWLVLPVAVFVTLAVLTSFAPDFYAVYVESEQGVLELSHIALSACSGIIGLRILAMPALRGRPWLIAWTAIMTLGAFYIAGEEASWGQQLFFWATPESWQAINDQQETNLHNVSSWLDQKPRALLELGVIVGGILIPIAALFRPALRRSALAIILPPLLILPTAILVEVSRLPERLGDLLVGHSVLFSRGSEVQEFYFGYFILLYAIVLRRRLRAGL